jgi:hypothetical protein
LSCCICIECIFELLLWLSMTTRLNHDPWLNLTQIKRRTLIQNNEEFSCQSLIHFNGTRWSLQQWWEARTETIRVEISSSSSILKCPVVSTVWFNYLSSPLHWFLLRSMCIEHWDNYRLFCSSIPLLTFTQSITICSATKESLPWRVSQHSLFFFLRHAVSYHFMCDLAHSIELIEIIRF